MVLSGLLGKKLGMTHLFGEGGRVVPVTVVEVGPCVVTQLRTQATDGYEAVQVGYGETKQLNKPKEGHLKRAKASRVRRLAEFSANQMDDYQLGQTVAVNQFFVGERVHVSALSKGRGFQGVVKRFGNAGGPKTHGQGDRHRAPGSIGSGTFPGRVYKGQKMPGHMGDRKVTVRGLLVALVDRDRNLLMVKGAIPGSRNAFITVRHANMEAAVNAYEELLTAPPQAAEVVEQAVPDVVEQIDVQVAGEESAEVATQPSAEVAEQPSAEVAEQPSAEVAEQPSAEVAEQPSAEVAEQPSAEVAEQPSAEVAEQPSAEVAEQPSAEVAEQPSAEVTEQEASEASDAEKKDQG